MFLFHSTALWTEINPYNSSWKDPRELNNVFSSRPFLSIALLRFVLGYPNRFAPDMRRSLLHMWLARVLPWQWLTLAGARTFKIFISIYYIEIHYTHQLVDNFVSVNVIYGMSRYSVPAVRGRPIYMSSISMFHLLFLEGNVLWTVGLSYNSTLTMLYR